MAEQTLPTGSGFTPERSRLYSTHANVLEEMKLKKVNAAMLKNHSSHPSSQILEKPAEEVKIKKKPPVPIKPVNLAGKSATGTLSPSSLSPTPLLERALSLPEKATPNSNMPRCNSAERPNLAVKSASLVAAGPTPLLMERAYSLPENSTATLVRRCNNTEGNVTELLLESPTSTVYVQENVKSTTPKALTVDDQFKTVFISLRYKENKLPWPYEAAKKIEKRIGARRDIYISL